MSSGRIVTLGSVKAKAIEAHAHHAASSTGSSCVEYHMPGTALSVEAQIRDHSISLPVLENTIRHGIPNACKVRVGATVALVSLGISQLPGEDEERFELASRSFAREPDSIRSSR